MHFVEQDIRLTRGGKNLWVAREFHETVAIFTAKLHISNTRRVDEYVMIGRRMRIELNWKRFYDSFFASQSSLPSACLHKNDNLIHFKLEFMIQFSRHSLRVIERNWKIGLDFFIKYLVTDLLLGVRLEGLFWERGNGIISVMCQSKLAFEMNYDPSDGKLQIYFNFLAAFPEADAREISRQKLHKFPFVSCKQLRNN